MRGVARGMCPAAREVLAAGALLGAVFAPGGAAGARADGPAPFAFVDSCDDVAGWSAYAADGVDVSLRSDTAGAARALRVDFDFRKGSGYAVVRRELAPPVGLPENYVFSFRVRAEAPVNHLEFKLIDESGDNVWWSVRRDFAFPKAWEAVRIKKRHVSFAWGPRGGGELAAAAAIEIAITAGSGERGTIWIDDLALEALSPAGAWPPPISAWSSSGLPDRPASLATDGNPVSFWQSGPSDPAPWIALALGDGACEFGGLLIDWAAGYPARYVVEISNDREEWRSLRTIRCDGGDAYLYLPETESRYVRLRALPPVDPGGIGIAEIAAQPLEFSSSENAFLQRIAKDSRRGTFPRGMSGEAVYWTAVGADGDPAECLLGEDGAIEIGRGECSIEPFLVREDELVGWSDVRSEQALADGGLPFPSVRWRTEDLELVVTAFPIGEPGASSVLVRYRVTAFREGTDAGLVFAIRPFQVNPPYQFLATTGGFAPIDSIAEDGSAVSINGRRRIVELTPSGAFHAGHGGRPGEQASRLLPRLLPPPDAEASQTLGTASGVLSYDLRLEAGRPREIDLLLPLHGDASPSPPAGAKEARAWADAEIAAARAAWEEKLGRVTIRLPESAAEIERTLKAQLAYILVNRAGPAIQPGTRSYARSWIRDGSLTSSALLRLGHAEVVRDFIEWFAPNQYENGKVPCVVDARGPDPVPEHDSGGEFVFLVAEYERYTKDRDLAERMWPRVAKAAAYLDSLRGTRRTAEYREPGKEHFFGLLPPSISHEGYSAKPMHSYWDDFWALRGFRDAAYLAGLLGREEERRRWTAVRSEFETELALSIAAAMRVHGVDYIPGCADLGDFDATSTTIALAPAGAEAILPPGALARTFEKYWEFFRERRETDEWEAFTPYETRSIGAFVRLGWRERAHELVRYFLSHRRPAGWAHWAEVVWRDPRAPKFIGDMPHTWVGSDFVRSVLDMLVYPREADGALVVGAGIPEAWIEDPEGVGASGLPTPYGPIAFSMRAAGGKLEARIDSGLRVPPGGIALAPPIEWGGGRVTVDGKPAVRNAAGEIVVREVPAVVTVER